MKSKIQALCEIALEVVERHGEGKLAGPKDSHSIMELEKFANEVIKMFEPEAEPEESFADKLEALSAKPVCAYGNKACIRGFIICPQCFKDNNG